MGLSKVTLDDPILQLRFATSATPPALARAAASAGTPLVGCEQGPVGPAVTPVPPPPEAAASVTPPLVVAWVCEWVSVPAPLAQVPDRTRGSASGDGEPPRSSTLP